jgi:hypothetical protein
MTPRAKTAFIAALLISSASLAFAAFDGDGNPVPNGHQYGTIVEQAAPAFVNAFASTRRAAPAQRQELDGDANSIPPKHQEYM